MAHSLHSLSFESVCENQSIDTLDIDDRWRNVLVSISDPVRDRQLVRRAGEYAVGTGGKLVLLSVMPSEEFSERQYTSAKIRHLPEYTIEQAEEARQRTASDVARKALAALRLEYTAVGTVGAQTTQILNVAHRFDCGHIFVRERSQSGIDRLFGRDPNQAIRRQFDGLVTVLPNASDFA
ncbi:universal stress protein (plasmid) [Haloferacaceae archaeon DSL9]